MLGKYKERVARLSAPAREALVEEFELSLMDETGRGYLVPRSPGPSLAEALDRSGLSSADVVLVLLRRGFRREGEVVAGTRVEVGAPALHSAAALPPRAAPGWEEERLVRLSEPNPRKPGTDAARHYDAARVGMTRAALMTRGVTRRDMREWERRKWARFEGRKT